MLQNLQSTLGGGGGGGSGGGSGSGSGDGSGGGSGDGSGDGSGCGSGNGSGDGSGGVVVGAGDEQEGDSEGGAARVGHPFFSKERFVLAFISVQWK